MKAAQDNLLASLDRDGFVLLGNPVSDADISELIDALEAVRQSACAPGMRNLLNRCDRVRIFALSQPAYDIASVLLGPGAHPVRAILFDKTPAANWYVTWHQDLSIPVKRQIDTPGYGPWSMKHGVVHVQPPANILERMVSLRIHLDDCQPGNGPIKFISGSHLNGCLDPGEITMYKTSQESISCPANRGDIIAMRPLVLHSSSQAQIPGHRRVLHIEYANAELPSGIEWAEA
jgi:Phytanoyl-CoA dioxygenase (PhyH)